MYILAVNITCTSSELWKLVTYIVSKIKLRTYTDQTWYDGSVGYGGCVFEMTMFDYPCTKCNVVRYVFIKVRKLWTFAFPTNKERIMFVANTSNSPFIRWHFFINLMGGKRISSERRSMQCWFDIMLVYSLMQ